MVNFADPIRGKGPIRRTAIFVVLLAAFGAWAWVEHGSLLRGVANFWIVSDEVTHADAVVVLGGGLTDRPRVTADLYKTGLAHEVLVSQVAGDPSSTEANRQALLKLGVPASVIETFGRANKSTKDQALAVREWVERHNAKVVIIPSEIFFTRRVSRCYQLNHRSSRGQIGEKKRGSSASRVNS